eukprot:1157718-Pelagomonas_calceolata.AAC.2
MRSCTQVVLSSDEPDFGGYSNVTKKSDVTFPTGSSNHDNRPHDMMVYAPSRTVVGISQLPSVCMREQCDALLNTRVRKVSAGGLLGHVLTVLLRDVGRCAAGRACLQLLLGNFRGLPLDRDKGGPADIMKSPAGMLTRLAHDIRSSTLTDQYGDPCTWLDNSGASIHAYHA